MRLSLTVKLTLLFLVFGLVPMLILGTIAYRAAGTIEDGEGVRYQVAAEGIGAMKPSSTDSDRGSDSISD